MKTGTEAVVDSTPTIEGEALAVQSDEGTRAELAPASSAPNAVLNAFSVQTFSQYLSTWQIQGTSVTDFSAAGYRHLAGEFGISIAEQEVSTADDGGYLIQTRAECPDGRSNVCWVYQATQRTDKRTGELKPIPHALEIGSQRGARNAIKALLPAEALKTLLQQAVKTGEAQKSALSEAQQGARQALREMRHPLREMELNPEDAFEIAKQEQGEDTSEWGVTEWNRFARKVRGLDEDWFGKPAP